MVSNADNLSTHPLLKMVFEIGFKPNTFAIFGSGPLFAHGLIDELNDVDILVNADGWKKALTLDSVDHTDNGDPVIHVGDDIEIFNNWAPGTWDTQELIDQAETINGLPFVQLKSVLAWKKLRNIPKDQRHIHLIEDYQQK